MHVGLNGSSIVNGLTISSLVYWTTVTITTIKSEAFQWFIEGGDSENLFSVKLKWNPRKVFV